MFRDSLVLLLPLALSIACRAEDAPAYRLGDVATNNVFTHTRLLVVDDEATGILREREAAKIDLFVVYSTNHAAFLRSNASLSIQKMRGEFLNVLRSNFGTDRLTPEIIQGDTFKDLLDRFLILNPGPPVPRETFPLWAAGERGEDYLENWCAPLEDVLRVPVRHNALPPGVRWGPSRTVNLVQVDDLRTYVKEAVALATSKPFSANRLVSLGTARMNLRAACSNQGPAVTSFLLDLLEPNCRVDTNLTGRARDLAVSGLTQMKQFEPGEVVVREGQTIDTQALAALTAMREQAKVTALEKEVAVKAVSVQLLGERNLWLIGLLGSTACALIGVLVWAQRRRRRELTPVLSTSIIHQSAGSDGWDGTTVVDALPDEAGHWRRRALEAERQAERAKELARSKLMPQFARQFKDNVVQQMASQMDEMIGVQAEVAKHMASLEARLERIQAPLQERLQTYERRISELELELTRRG
ncbi:MAG: hypothetical protein MUC91_13795, partial [Verrucomicrobia bacterium]|nr:hypothetical protein [Verrucomicrobiota bacterium]